MQQDDVAGAPGTLQEIPALSGQLLEREATGNDALRMLRQEPRHDRNGVAGDERAAALRRNVRPEDQRQQSLLRAIQEMAEEVAVLVPARRLRRGGLPGPIRPVVEVDDEAIAHCHRLADALLDA